MNFQTYRSHDSKYEENRNNESEIRWIIGLISNLTFVASEFKILF